MVEKMAVTRAEKMDKRRVEKKVASKAAKMDE